MKRLIRMLLCMTTKCPWETVARVRLGDEVLETQFCQRCESHRYRSVE